MLSVRESTPLLLPRLGELSQVVWTRSGTGALRELGETFPWSPASRFAYLVSNHNRCAGCCVWGRLNE